ncbi:nucleotidyl transferase AbiEii/AbiGii toxin family protein, partial [archaeon]|nr:nucleotidyl transferase AbiEii/AbiGii toxin family protein [archaeon]
RNSPKILIYPPLNPVVRVEEREEILADKIIAIILRRYLKGRDIWDIHYLTDEMNVLTSQELLEKKIRDYGVGDFQKRIRESREKLLKEGVDALDREMKRFMPISTYNQLKISFEEIVESVAQEILKYTGKGEEV